MFGFIKKIPFLKFVLINQKCTTQPTLINLHANEYTQQYVSNHLRLI